MSPRSAAGGDQPVLAEDSESQADPPRRFRSVYWILLGICGCMLLMVGLIAYQHLRNRDQLYEIAKETTYVTEHLTPQGRPDYPAAINTRLGEGVTPETNAAVKLWEAIGPRPLQSSLEFHEAMAAELGMDPLPEHGTYLANIHQWLAELPDPPADINARAQELYDELSIAHRGAWQTTDHPDLAVCIKRNEIPLQRVHEAMQRPHYYRPMIVHPATPGGSGRMFTYLLNDVQTYREIARLLNARAMWHLGEGRVDAAIQDLLDGHRLARKTAQGWTIIEALVGIAIDAIMSQGANALLVDPQLTAVQAKYYREQLAKFGPVLTIEQMALSIDQGERFMGLDVVVAMAHGQVVDDDLSMLGMESFQTFLRYFSAVGINWNRALIKMNREYDEIVAAYELPEREERLKALTERTRQLEKQRGELFRWSGGMHLMLGGSGARGQALGTILTALLFPAAEHYQIAFDRSTMSYETLLIGLALAEYRCTHDRYPAKLEELVPDFLAEIPLDVYTGGPLNYHVSEDGREMKIYSVGENGLDDNGIRYGDHEATGQQGDDIGFVDPILQLPPEPETESDTSQETTETDSASSDSE